MDKAHYILIGICILFIVLYGLQKSSNIDYKNELDIEQAKIERLEKTIKNKNGLIKDLKETTTARDTIINLLKQYVAHCYALLNRTLLNFLY